MNIKKLHRNTCRELESMTDDDDEGVVTRTARKFIHNAVKVRKTVQPATINATMSSDNDESFEEELREVG